jgi:hypothetical protein
MKIASVAGDFSVSVAKKLGLDKVLADLNRKFDGIGNAPNKPPVIPDSDLVKRIQAKIGLYPKVIDPRSGREITFPSAIQGKTPKDQRVAWTSKDRGAFIKEWYDRGYQTPKGGWDKYDVHHIQPREFGGSNNFNNLVPVERNTHREFNKFWREFNGL